MGANDFPRGAGGGGGGKGGNSGGTHVAVEAPDSLRSIQVAQILDFWSNGPIRGPVDGAKSIMFDGTPLVNEDGSVNFTGVRLAWSLGTVDQGYFPGLDEIGNATTVGVEIHNATPIVRSISNSNVDAVRVTVGVPRLTNQNTTNGDLNGSSVSLAIDIQTDGGGYVTALTDTITGKGTTRYQKDYRIPLTGDGPWDIRVRRLSADSTSSAIVNDLFWDAYTELIDEKFTFPMSAAMMTEVNAEQFNQIPVRSAELYGIIIDIPSNYDPETRTYDGIWDGTFVPGYTNNPAWHWRWIQVNDLWGLGEYIPEDAPDKWALYQIAQRCDGMVPDGFGGMEPRYTLNCYLQTREEAFKVLSTIAGMFDAMGYYGSGFVGIAQDAPTDAVKLFTAANVENGDFKYTGTDRKARYTTCLVTWYNPKNHYRPETLLCQDLDAIRRYGINQKEIVAFGCTSPGQAMRAGNREIYTSIYETEVVTFVTGLQAAEVWPGNIIDAADPFRAGKRLGGRINGGDVNTVELDAPVTLLPGIAYTLACQMKSNGQVVKRLVATAPGERTVLELSSPLPEEPLQYGVWMLGSSDVQPTQWRVLTVSGDGIKGTVTALKYHAGKFALIEQGVKFDTPPTTAVRIKPDPVTGIEITESMFESAPGVPSVRVTIAWIGKTPRYRVEYRCNDGNWVRTPDPTTCLATIDNASPGDYEFRVYAINAIGAMSTAATAEASIQGLDVSAAPENFELEEAFIGRVCRVRADAAAGAKAYKIEVLSGSPLAVKRTKILTEPRFEYGYQDAQVDGVGRAFTLRLYNIAQDGNLSAPAELSVENAQISTAVPDVEVFAGYLSANLMWNRTEPADYAGVVVCMGTTSGFTPDESNQVLSVEGKVGSVLELTPGVTYYFRLAAYDVWGTDDLYFGPTEYEVTASLSSVTAGEILEKIRDSLTDPDSADGNLILNADRFAFKVAGTDRFPFIIGEVGGEDVVVLDADVIIGGNVSVANLTSGEVPTDVLMTLGGGMIVIDGAGAITIYKALGTNQDYLLLNAGKVSVMKYIPGTGYVEYKSLSRREQGQVANGTTFTLPGYWDTQPMVLVSPANMQFYKASYAAQDQTIQCDPGPVTETSPGSRRWQLTPTAQLVLASGTQNTSINSGSGDTSAGSWTSPTYTTAANTNGVTPNVSLKSVRGNGSSQYFRRTMRWRVEYWNGSSWVALAWRTLSMGDQTASAVNDSFAYSFPSAGTWQWRLYVEDYDTDGSVFGSVSYNYSTEDLNGSTSVVNISGGSTARVSRDLPSSSVNPSWEIYQIDHTWTVSWSKTVLGNSLRFYVDQYSGHNNLKFTATANSGGTTITETFSGSSLPLFLQSHSVAMNPSTGTATINATLNRARVYRRNPIPNSSTAVNNSFINSYSYSLASATVLATGTLNYLAVGE